MTNYDDLMVTGGGRRGRLLQSQITKTPNQPP